MVANWDATVATQSALLKKRIRKGIPDSMRANVWLKLAGAQAASQAG